MTMQRGLRVALVFVWLCSIGLVAQISRTDGTAMTVTGTPTISACGTAPSVVGSNSHGTITVGSGVVTSCTLSFSSALASAPSCVVSSTSTAIGLGATTTTAALTLAFSASLGGGKVHFICLEP